MSSSNYPCGAEHDKNAPYNEIEIPFKTFDCTISSTLSKDSSYETDDYVLEKEEDGNNSLTLGEYINVVKEYKEQHYTPIQLIEKLKEICVELIHHPTPTKPLYERSYLRCLIKECEGWVEDELEIV